MRDTSIEAFNTIRDSGVLTKMQFRAYEFLYNNGPLTGNEIDKKSGSTSYHKRLSELEKNGVIATKVKRICSISGVEDHEWDVTSFIPATRAKSDTPSRPKRDQIAAAVAFIEDMYRLITKNYKDLSDRHNWVVLQYNELVRERNALVREAARGGRFSVKEDIKEQPKHEYQELVIPDAFKTVMPYLRWQSRKKFGR